MNFIKINPADNVAVALADLRKGESIRVLEEEIILNSDIPRGHKFALIDLGSADSIIKYGFPIGKLKSAVRKGDLINHENLGTALSGISDYTYNPVSISISAKKYPKETFRGFRRASGEVGIRNQIWIIPMVGCVNNTVRQLADIFGREISADMGSVDCVVGFEHNYGCSQLGDDHENTRKFLRNMILHPNAGGILMVGLGCENNQMGAFKEMLPEGIDTQRIRFIETQKIKGDEIEYGLNELREIFAVCRNDQRTECKLSDLKIGLKCGGSDGLSGITANPLLGEFSDFLNSRNGTTVLTEVPEMFGAETILMDRCKNRELFDKTVSLINNFKQYFMSMNQPIYENPSPGNKAGGISTLEEKSLGCTQKSGKSAVCGVLEYGERIQEKGLNLLSAPGNDLVAASALASAGCQLILFTTGRGTPFGTFVPTMKVSTNTPLYEAKPHWIDFNAGQLVEGKPMNELLDEFIGFVISVCEGHQLNHEKRGGREIAIFKKGVTL